MAEAGIDNATEMAAAGSGVKRSATLLSVTGMTCGNCARHVSEAIQSIPGVHSASVNLDAQQATVRWVGAPSPDDVLKAIEEAGYQAKVAEPDATRAHKHKLAGWHISLWVGVVCTVPLMLGEWVFGWGRTAWFPWFAFALASVVQFVSGAAFYRGAWAQLKMGNSNMDTLVSLGSTTAYLFSVFLLFSGTAGHLYFMESAAIITLVSLGHWLESRVAVRASGALRNLLNLAPLMARRKDADGSESEVPAADLDLGDLVAIRPGDRVPTDGVVVDGASAIDESMLTGESAPVEKAAGNPVYTGTTNLNGRLLARVTATGEETALASIIASVQRAQTSRADIQRLADRVSSIFVPIVIGIALAAGLWWALAPASAHAVHHWLGQFLWPGHVPATAMAAGFIIAAAVLIIACPCAMGLATPAAIMAGSNAAAARGILIRDGVALEKAGTITTVLFDKTGTLTIGKPVVAEIWRAPVTDRAKIDQLAASLALHSSHPISRAVARLDPGDIALQEWEEVRGAGVQANVKDELGTGEARLGSLPWMNQNAVDLAPGEAFIAEWSGKGATIVALAINKSLLALFALRDSLKPGAPGVVRQLQTSGLKVFLVTGDNSLTGSAIAREAGIDSKHVFAEVRPEQKAEFVRKLQRAGERVAFVGDGINDAPALEQADLGIAVTKASDIAREAADIILLKSEIEAVPESLGLARATLRTIKQNLFWAFFYNSVGIPLAAFGFMSPILCAAAMGFSDVVVIGNALRLRRWRLHKG